jgi:membrane-associated protein
LVKYKRGHIRAVLMNPIIDFFLHLDKYLSDVIQVFGVWTYLILFSVIFCETGLVITPFLPGDSLLFAAGAFAAMGVLNIWWLFFVLLAAAVLGDTANYWMGYHAGRRIFKKKDHLLFNKEYLEHAHEFYKKHGSKTIVIARWIPIVRTFAPFVAGIGKMRYAIFFTYNLIGGLAWVSLFTFGGYFFGNIPFIKNNFSIVIIIIIGTSVIPLIYEILKKRKK